MSPVRPRSSSPTTSASATAPACRKCYTRKKKCDRGLPRCSNCARSDHECVYQAAQPDSGHRQIISKLEAENEQQRAQIQELQQRLRILSSANTSPVVPLAPTQFPTLPSNNIFLTFSEPTIAERIVSQLLNTEIDVQGAARSLVAQTAQQFSLTVPTLTTKPSSTSSAVLLVDTTYSPSKSEAERMIDAYFEFGNSFQPIMDPEAVSQDLDFLYPHGSNTAITLSEPPEPDVRVYRIFIIFAIGSSLLPKNPSNPSTASLRARALAHFPAALRSDDVTCLTCIVLFCIYSMTDSAPMDPYQTVGIAARLAMELGYLADNEMLSWHVRERRKRIFWSIYCMDRSISSTLSRPLAIREDIIRISLPMNLPDLSGRHTTFMQTAALFRQTVLLRRLQGMVSTQIAQANPATTDKDTVFSRLRNEIDTWYDELPTMTTPTSSPARKHPYLEVNYHLLLVRMYSPSPLFPRPSQSGMSILRQSAFRVIEMYGAGTQEYRMRQNYITLCHIILACVALVYSVGEAEGDPMNMGLRSWRRGAVQHIESAEKYLANFCWHLVYAEQYTDGFARLSSDLRARLCGPEPSESQPDWLASHVPPSGPSNLLDFASGLPWGDLTQVGDGGGVFQDDPTVDDFLASFGLGAFPA